MLYDRLNIIDIGVMNGVRNKDIILAFGIQSGSIIHSKNKLLQLKYMNVDGTLTDRGIEAKDFYTKSHLQLLKSNMLNNIIDV